MIEGPQNSAYMIHCVFEEDFRSVHGFFDPIQPPFEDRNDSYETASTMQVKPLTRCEGFSRGRLDRRGRNGDEAGIAQTAGFHQPGSKVGY